MTRDEAQALIGQRRLRERSNGQGKVVHECVKVTGNCSVGADGVYEEDYDKVWVTAFQPGETMWTGLNNWFRWELTDEEPETVRRQKEIGNER